MNFLVIHFIVVYERVVFFKYNVHVFHQTLSGYFHIATLGSWNDIITGLRAESNMVDIWA